MRFHDGKLNYFVGFMVLGFILVLGQVGRGDSATDFLEELKTQLLQTNPELQAARARVRASDHQVGVAVGLSAPQVGIDYFQIPAASFPDPLKNNMEIDYFAQQEFMFPGKWLAMGTAEQQRRRMLEQTLHQQEQKLVRDLKSNYYALWEIDRKLAINRQNLDLMEQLQTITRKQYELGAGSQSDVLRAQTEFTALQSTRLILMQTRQFICADLNALLGHPPDNLWATVTEPSWSSHTWSLAQLTPLAEAHQPEWQAALWNVGMARAEQSAGFWNFFPDFMAKGMYKDMQGNGENFWSLMLGVTLPIAPWSLPKTISGYQKSLAEVDQAEAEFRQIQNQVHTQVQQRLTQMVTNQAIAQLTRKTLLVQAEQTLQSTLAAYQTGKSDFMALLDAYRMLWSARENEALAIRNVLTSQADLEQAVGLSLPEIAAALHSGEEKP